MYKNTEKFRRAIRLENVFSQAIGNYKINVLLYGKNRYEEGKKLMALATELYRKTPKSMKHVKRFFKKHMNGYNEDL
jgi:hypothetical protein